MFAIKRKVAVILALLERAFKLDFSNLAKGGLWTSLSFLVGTLGSIVTMIAFGNLLPREIYGSYSYLLSLGASLSFLTLSGTGTAVIRSVARGYERIIPAAFKFQLKWNLLPMGVMLSVALYYGYKDNLLFAASLVLLSLAYPLAESFHLYKSILTGQRRFHTLTKITNITTLVGAIATVTTLLLTENILVLIAVYTIMALIPNLIAYRWSIRDIDKTPPQEEELSEMKRTSIHMTGAGIIGIVASYIDRVALFQIAGPGALAVYSFAIAGPDRLKSLSKNLMSVGFSNLTRRSLSQIREVFYWRVFLLFFLGAVLFLSYWFIAPFVFSIFLPKYLDAVPYSRMLASGIMFVPVTAYLGGIFAGQNMLKATYALNLSGHLTRITLFITLAWFWQIWGLVVASVLSQIISLLSGIMIWERESKRLIKVNENQ